MCNGKSQLLHHIPMSAYTLLTISLIQQHIWRPRDLSKSELEGFSVPVPQQKVHVQYSNTDAL